jgi:predicted ATP-grasp superfamily ATP-dependent carboligase
MKKCFIIFSGYNQRAVFAFIRTLAAEKADFAVIAASKEDPIFDSAYADRVQDVRRSRELTTDNVLRSIRKIKNKMKAEACIIAPSTEALNRFLISNRVILEKNGCEVPLAGKKIYETISDKYIFSGVCGENGITVPGEYRTLEEAKLPFAAKPKKYFSDTGGVYDPVLVFTAAQKDDFLRKHDPGHFYYQEYIEGKSIYLLYYFSKSGKIYKYSQENLAQQPCGKSIVAAVSSAWHRNPESRKYERLFRKLGFYGLVMVEVRKRGNKFFMIEANPRFWGPSQLFVDAGANFFKTFLEDQGVIKSTDGFHGKAGIKYFWLGGMSGKKCVFYGERGRKVPKNMRDWTARDVYNREDTALIFKKETKPEGRA